MTKDFHHISVLYEEVLEGLRIRPDGIYVDGTLGGAGHSEGILRHLTEGGRLIGIDQDPAALEAAKTRLSPYGEQFIPVKANYQDFEKVLDNLGISKVDGVLLDLGVSSVQFDEADRGFSYRYNAILDMRMSDEEIPTAKDLVENLSEQELTRIFRDFGEERWASRVASFIVKWRREKPIETTGDLVEVIKAAIPKGARRHGGHPAKRIFQGLRIAVNDELGVLERSLPKMMRRLKKGGRIAVITFHSLEDRIVKEGFKEAYRDCICPSESPICTCDKVREIDIITRKVIVPSKEELEANPRSHSAKLRIAEKIVD